MVTPAPRAAAAASLLALLGACAADDAQGVATGEGDPPAFLEVGPPMACDNPSVLQPEIAGGSGFATPLEAMESWRRDLVEGGYWVMPDATAEPQPWTDEAAAASEMGWYDTETKSGARQFVYLNSDGLAVIAVTFGADDKVEAPWVMRNFIRCGDAADDAGIRPLHDQAETPE